MFHLQQPIFYVVIIMKSFAIAALAASVPAVLACSNPDTDACAGAYVANSDALVDFCATFTTAVATDSSAVPTVVASACANKAKKLSSACSCFITGGGAATASATGAAPTAASARPTGLLSASGHAMAASSTKKTSTSTKADSTVKETATSTIKATSAAAEATAIQSGSGTTCTVTAYASISSAVASCSNIVLSNISAPPSSTLDLQKLLPSAVVIFAGETTFGTTVDSDFDPIVVSGDYITITGAAGHVIDGNGAAYWDGEGSNGGTDKPDHFFVVKDTSHATISNLNIQNWPVHCFDMTGNEYLTVSGLTLNNSAGDAPNSASGDKAAAHNSDGFDISSSDFVTLSGVSVYNQDDCVAVTSGSYITVDNFHCSGGHGLSIGSIGGKSNNTVDHVTFSNSVVTDSQNGCRIKSNSGTTGTISNIAYSNITLSSISDYGIDIQQDYLNGGATGKPTNGVTISGVSFTDVTGTMSDGDSYYILCGSDSCTDFTFSGVSITGGASSCNYPSTGCPS